MNLQRLAQKSFTDMHATVYRFTNGLIGHRMGPTEAVLLTTTGRRSGQPRVTPLTATPDGERIILVASNGGAPKHPDWYLNLQAHPDVELQRGGDRRIMRARMASSDERDALWAKVVRTYGGYDGYQRRTNREIPLVVCEPAGETTV